jgi:outer membrane receptor protein involved in Fe transport
MVHAQEAQPAADGLAEIVVTASKRAQNLLDVPYNISAVTSAQIAKAGVSSVGDLIQLVPGVVQADQGPALYGSGNGIIMRGLNAQAIGSGEEQQVVPPVSTYLGDIPVFFPLTLTDIERVELLRGPQGTLYGSGSAGGTIRFIPKSPRLGETSVELNTSVGSTKNASQLNTDVNGVLNIPFGERLAIRTVAGYKRLAGFIDAVALIRTANGSALGSPTPAVPGDLTSGFVLAPERDTNSSADWFVRSTARWKPVDHLTLDLTYHHQMTHVADAQSSNPYWKAGTIDYSARDFPGSRGPDIAGIPGGGLYPNGATVIPDGGDYRSTKFSKSPYDRKVDVVGLEGSYDVGFASLTSTTSYFDNKVDFLTDQTSFYLNVTNPAGGTPLAALYGFYPRLTAPTFSNRDVKTFTEEFRIASTWNRSIDYVLGAYYSDEKGRDLVSQYNPGITDFSNATTQFVANPQLGDLNWHAERNLKFLDKALFGELTWHVTPKLQTTVGSRVFWQSFTNTYFQELPICGAFCGDGVSANQNLGTSNIGQQRTFHDHIGKLNVSYDLFPGTKLYATYSEGFRRGGANAIATAGYFASLPQYGTFKPDLAKNYEIGVKGSRAGRFNYTVAVYQIDWSNFQFQGITPSAMVAVFNGSKARSRGVELEGEFEITRGLVVTAGYSYIDAKLTQSFQIVDFPQYGYVNQLPLVVGISGAAGDRLPGSPQHSGTLAVNYTVPLPWLGSGKWTLDLNSNASYRSSIIPAFPSSALFPSEVPATTIVNARAELDYAQSWSVDLSVSNVTNALGMSLAIPVDHAGPFSSANIAQPRTVTLGLHYRM